MKNFNKFITIDSFILFFNKFITIDSFLLFFNKFITIDSFILFFNKFVTIDSLYPQTKVGDILDSGPSRRRRRRRNFLVDAITQKQINIFFSNLVHMLNVPKGRSLF